jgi:hypothetical protein
MAVRFFKITLAEFQYFIYMLSAMHFFEPNFCCCCWVDVMKGRGRFQNAVTWQSTPQSYR